MRKFAFIIFLSVGCLVASMQHSYAQTDPNATTEGDAQPAPVKKKGKKGKTQADLDADAQSTTQDQMSPEQKAYLKKMAATKKE
ncbi:MAG: outer membrane integrity protein, partial [Cytophagales bacterium]|nr:outer membrane integrity protein [Cytophaga sp.]